MQCVSDMLSFSMAVNWIYGHRLAQTKLLIDHIPRVGDPDVGAIAFRRRRQEATREVSG